MLKLAETWVDNVNLESFINFIGTAFTETNMHHTFSDEQLLDLLRQGDEVAFTMIYNRYWDKLFTVAAHKLNNAAEAEEVVQEIFLDLWNRREIVQVHSALSSYLAVAVKYKVINILAHRNVKLKALMELKRPEADYSTSNWLSFEELQENLEKLVAKLPGKCRIVFRMSRSEGLTQKQIASALDISEKTVEAHLGKAIRILRTGLQVLILFRIAGF